MSTNKEKKGFFDTVIYFVRRFIYEVARPDRYKDGLFEGCLIWIFFLFVLIALVCEFVFGVDIFR